MKVSVIIPVFNEEGVIGKCLESLAKQTMQDFEVIIVDDGSKDKSLKVIKSLKIKNYKLRILRQQHKGPAVARNLGAKKAKGKILIFVDADMTFERNFLKRLIKPIEDSKAKGVFSKQEYVSNWQNVWARAWNINQGWPTRRRHPKDYPNKQKVFRAILKSEFDRVGGFDRGGYTDDYTLSDKLGYLAVEVKGAKFYHKNPDSLSEVFAQAKWVAKRDYKFGAAGILIVLVRASTLFSFLVGTYKALKHKMPGFVVFKFIYNLGVSIGILEFYILNRGYK